LPREGLTTAKVVDEAERLVDEVGLSRLTLAALAARLNIRQPSLYKHIDGMSGLQRAIAQRASAELAHTLARAAVGKARGDAIVAMAQAYRAWALKHPGRYSATQIPVIAGDIAEDGEIFPLVQVVSDVLAGYQLQGDESIHALRTLRSALQGFIALESGGGFGDSVDVEKSFNWLLDALVSALSARTELQFSHH
jgi:AcrR family transcriptional regulator